MANEFRLEIKFDADTRDCKVTGPLNEPDLCLLGLEMARRIIAGLKARKIISVPTNSRVLLPASRQIGIPLPDFLSKRNGGAG
jgi:hypothetical protein